MVIAGLCLGAEQEMDDSFGVICVLVAIRQGQRGEVLKRRHADEHVSSRCKQRAHSSSTSSVLVREMCSRTSWATMWSKWPLGSIGSEAA